MTTPRSLLAALAAASLLAACASTLVQQDEASAEGHRAEAKKERDEAAQHLVQYDPKASMIVGGEGRDPGFSRADTRYNPTQWHLTEAEKHSRHAAQHEAAAAQLDAFEERECQAFSPAMRAACPALVPLASMVDIEDGVRMVPAEGIDIVPVVAHMQCHLAYARAQGFQEGECPLYIKGISIRVSQDQRAIEIVATEKSALPELRRRAHATARIEVH